LFTGISLGDKVARASSSFHSAPINSDVELANGKFVRLVSLFQVKVGTRFHALSLVKLYKNKGTCAKTGLKMVELGKLALLPCAEFKKLVYIHLGKVNTDVDSF